MDQAALRERRAARERRMRRRRRRGLAGALVALIVLVAALVAGRGEHARPASGSASAAPAIVAPSAAPPTRTATTARSAPLARTVMAGAHRAPREPVPILMYHVIGLRPPTAPNPSLWVAPGEFAEHVAALAKAGYHAVTQQQVWDAWHHRGELPGKPIVLSFDDGYTGDVRDALPALAARGWPGVLNLEVANIKGMGGTKAVKRLVRAGWEIGAHTLTHPDLTTLGASQLRDEILGSRNRLRRMFGVPVRFFCYPSGRYDATVIAAVRRAGYLGATTTQPGWATPSGDPYSLSRVRVDGGMSAAALLARVHDARS